MTPMIYRGSHPPPKYRHGDQLQGGTVTGRYWEYNRWRYTVIMPQGAQIIYVYGD